MKSKIISLFLALIMVFAFSSTALAEDIGDAGKLPAERTCEHTYQYVLCDDSYEATDEEDGAISIVLNDDVEGEGFTAVRVFGDDSTVNVTGNLMMSDEGDGTYDSDFTGMGTAVTSSDGADVYVKDVYFYSDGIVRSFANVSGANLFVEDSDLIAMGGNPFEDFYPDYINGSGYSGRRSW